MRTVAKTCGALLMVCSLLAWLWLGLFSPPISDLRSEPFFRWSAPQLLLDSQLGLTFVFVLVGGFGLALWKSAKE